jgi:hypothetical protein
MPSVGNGTIQLLVFRNALARQLKKSEALTKRELSGNIPLMLVRKGHSYGRGNAIVGARHSVGAT